MDIEFVSDWMWPQFSHCEVRSGRQEGLRREMSSCQQVSATVDFKHSLSLTDVREKVESKCQFSPGVLFGSLWQS